MKIAKALRLQYTLHLSEATIKIAGWRLKGVHITELPGKPSLH